MKPQDMLFLVIIIAVVIAKKPKISIILGLVSLLLSIPLFAKWVFFTAERLTWYAAGFFLIAIVLIIIQERTQKS